jgi:shikimate dehydrogenase
VSNGYAEVIGDPIAHSKSPLIHRFWLAKLGLSGDYLPRQVPPERLRDYFLEAQGRPDWRGCNVTSPHKQAILPLLGRLSSEAAAIGAANIVVREGDDLVGYNSDGSGFLEPLRPLLSRPHLFRMARLFGAGGAARAVAHALAGEGFTLVVSARDLRQAEALVEQLRGEHHAVALSHFAEPTAFPFGDRGGVLDLIVNATPLGMAGRPALPLDWSHVPPGSVVYDLVYAPLETPLLAQARARGHATIDGLSMLIGQAAIAFEHFFGRKPPRMFDPELREALLQ